MNEVVRMAYESTKKNRAKIFAHQNVGCLYCKKVFSSLEVTENVWDDKDTMQCPTCWLDLLVPGPITEELLEEIFKELFIPGKPTEGFVPFVRERDPELMTEEELVLYLKDKELIEYEEKSRDSWKIR